MSIRIPNFANEKVIDENGYFTPVWAQLFQQLLTQLVTNYNDEGLLVPNQTTTNISYLTDATKSNGAFLQNSDTGDLLFNVAGTWKTVTLT